MIPGPLPPARRIAAIGVLRGLALLGIVVVNSAYFGLPLAESLASKNSEGPMLDRIAGITNVDEVHALDHPTLVDVEARDHPNGTDAHDSTSSAATPSATVKRPS